MTLRRLMVLTSAAFLLTAHAATATEADSAAASAARGVALLQSGDFSEALAAYAAAAKADPGNEDYHQRHALLRRIIQMRANLTNESDAARWEATALALRSFYYDNALHNEALALDQQAHTRLRSSDSAARLAESRLAAGENSAAVDLLAALGESQHTFRTRILLGIALARTGRIDEAMAIAQIDQPKDAGPGQLYDVARLRALIGDATGAMDALTICFELTRPSRLAAFKDTAKADPDLRSIVGHDDFAKVLATASKIKESSCSTGDNCGKCPSRTKCAGESADTGKK